MGSKQLKPPAFLICDNPMTAINDGRTFILYTRSPQLFCEVFHFEDLSDAEIQYKDSLLPVASRLQFNNDTIYIVPIWPEYINANADKIANILRRMADWYKSYLLFEEDLE